MKEYYIEEFEADIETYEFDTLDISENTEEPEDAIIDKKEFEIVYFLDEVITKNAGNPPSGSGFDYISYENDNGNSYYTFVFKYNPDKKRHKEYLKKVYEIYYSESFFKQAEKIFEKKFLKFLKENVDIYE